MYKLMCNGELIEKYNTEEEALFSMKDDIFYEEDNGITGNVYSIIGSEYPEFGEDDIPCQDEEEPFYDGGCVDWGFGMNVR